MRKEYVSGSRRMQVKDSLEMLRLRSFMKEKEIGEVSDGLPKIVEHINELPPQCYSDFFYGSKKTYHLWYN